MACCVFDHETNDDQTYNLTKMTGSLRYMAPEVANGLPYNEACDVYSFTVVLWEMLALERPYKSLKTEDVIRTKVFRGGARPPVRGKWPKACRRILEEGWSLDHRRRPKMTQVSDELRNEVVRLRNGDETGLEHTRRRSTFVFRSSETKTTKKMVSCIF